MNLKSPNIHENYLDTSVTAQYPNGEPNCLSNSTLAIHGGQKQSQDLIPYSCPSIAPEDAQAVHDLLLSTTILTTGPQTTLFEAEFAAFTDSRYAVAVSNGTAALHCAVAAAGIQKDDEVIVTTLTFAASANAVVYQNAQVIFADVNPETLNIDPRDIIQKISPRTKAVIATDYAGQPCDYTEIAKICKKYNLIFISDASHSYGAQHNTVKVGANLADLTTFSFHPVKNLTTGEGGMIVTNNENYANFMRRFRSHGIDNDHAHRSKNNSHYYQMIHLGYNYRLSDLHCVLGRSQLKRFSLFIQQRNLIARFYDHSLLPLSIYIAPLTTKPENSHAYHLYVLQIKDALETCASRDIIFAALRAENIAVNVHYPLTHLHPFYKKRNGPVHLPVAQKAYSQIFSFPIFPTMSYQQASACILALYKVINFYLRAHGLPVVQAPNIHLHADFPHIGLKLC